MSVVNITAKRQSQNTDGKAATKNSRGLPAIPDSIPDKVYIEKKPEYEYTTNDPAMKERISRLLDGYYGQSNFLELFHCLPEIFAPVHEIASRVADARWELCKTWNDEADYKDADFNRLFSTPNPFMNIQQHVYVATSYYLLTGRLFWFKNNPDTLEQTYKNILAWFTLPSHQVWVDQIKEVDIYTCTEQGDYIRSYQLRDGITGIKGRKFEVNQVMPLIGFSLKHMYDMNRNNSPLSGADKAIKNLIPVYEARGTIYIKRGAMGFIVSRKSDDSGSVALTTTETEQLHTDYQATYGVVGGKSNIGITGQPIDFVQIGMNIKELQPFEETLNDAIAIYATLRVPRHLVPSSDQGTFSNVEISMKSFYDDVIIPLATMFAESWTFGMGFALTRKYVRPSYNHIEILQGNKKLKEEVRALQATTSSLLYKEGYITKNERNTMVGLQPQLDGDVYVSDENNKEPMGTKLLVGSLSEMMKFIVDPTIDPEIKYITLVEVFGMPKKTAAKIRDSAVTAKEEADKKAQQDAEALANENINNPKDNKDGNENK